MIRGLLPAVMLAVTAGSASAQPLQRIDEVLGTWVSNVRSCPARLDRPFRGVNEVDGVPQIVRITRQSMTTTYASQDIDGSGCSFRTVRSQGGTLVVRAMCQEEESRGMQTLRIARLSQSSIRIGSTNYIRCR